jgi:hypothetical protein
VPAFVGALVAGALTPGSSISPLAILGGGAVNHAAAQTVTHIDPLGRTHPVITTIAPPALLSTAARHVPAAAAGPRCDQTQVRGAQAAYQGRSVSALYDVLFTPGTQMPYLASYIPQSLADWPNWDGAGHDLLLLGMYSTGHRSYLVGLDPDSDRVVGTVTVDPSHLGGMAFFGSWLFAGDNPWPRRGSPTVQRYRIDDLRAAMLAAVATADKSIWPATGRGNPVNRVTALHTGSLSALLTALDPVALSAEREIGIAPGEPSGGDTAPQGIPGGLTAARGSSPTVATAAGAGLRGVPGVELWNPPQRVWNAYDYWLTRQAHNLTAPQVRSNSMD